MNIRNATIKDLQALAAVEAECFPPEEAATEADLRKRLEVYPEHFWLLCEGEAVIGFIDGMVTDEPDLRDEMFENASLHQESFFSKGIPAPSWPCLSTQGHSYRIH